MRDAYQDHAVDRTDPRHQLRGYPIISDQISRDALAVVCDYLEKVLIADIPGHIAEFGCYIGTTSLFIRRILDQYNQSANRQFHVYDSFEGLPEKGTQDNNAAGVDFEAGKLYVSKKLFLQQWKAANLQPPVIHKGWFNQLTDADVPNQLAFAFLDGDFYNSIHSSLKLVWPRMAQGGVVLIDDYQRPTLPGVERAVRDLLPDDIVRTIRHQHHIAILYKR